MIRIAHCLIKGAKGPAISGIVPEGDDNIIEKSWRGIDDRQSDFPTQQPQVFNSNLAQFTTPTTLTPLTLRRTVFREIEDDDIKPELCRYHAQQPL